MALEFILEVLNRLRKWCMKNKAQILLIIVKEAFIHFESALEYLGPVEESSSDEEEKLAPVLDLVSALREDHCENNPTSDPKKREETIKGLQGFMYLQ